MRPNIVFYFSDQQRADTVGVYGQKLNVTPNLDALAASGTMFNNAFTVQPVCGPARAVLQTGKYATETDCFYNGRQLPQSEFNLANVFNAAGYKTAYVGKWHLASDSDNDYSVTAIPSELRGGYKDYWAAADILEFTSHGYGGYVFDKDERKLEFTGYRCDEITNYAIDFIKDSQAEEPFFLFVSHIEPHHQNDRNRFEGPDGSKEKFKDYEVPGDLRDTDGDWREEYPDYLGACNSLDYNLGRIIDALKAQGIYENTVIIYTSDHGCHFRTRNEEYKRSCHDGSIKIPMIAVGPGFEGGKKIDELVSLLDIPVTLLDCAKVERPLGYRGNSLKKLAAGDKTGFNNEVLIQISESQTGRALRTDEWLYSVCGLDTDGYVPYAEVYYEEFLYDMKNDTFQMNNLVNHPDYADVRERLRERLIMRIKDAEFKTPTIIENTKARTTI